MDLTSLPRRKYTDFSTPIENLEKLSKSLGGPNIYIKRDDLLGLTAGGNKTRKLEFLIADALEKGADTIITAGGVQSNHCRLTLAAANRENLNCILVLEESAAVEHDTQKSGNYFLYNLMGVEDVRIVPNGTDVFEEMDKVASQVYANGGKPYKIPVGGSNSIGATGYVSCAQEIIQQSFDLGISFDYVVCTSGSGGMHAGLITGFEVNQSQTKVLGVSISRPKEKMEPKVMKLVSETTKRLGLQHTISEKSITCYDSYIGPGYALPTKEMVEAVKLVAKTEGILLDPVYTGKTMSGLIDLIKKGRFNSDDKVLFIHSGGAPALYAYTSEFMLGC
ncbi:D-cysteine desulfhydrase [Proteinivorax hydrogeniformans]|uniref:D-cysteine desulfhydrase n=1 Tax=Proteinivorax hydrogeniformans TaxID=1826727 RepID=A0AAU8HRK9_9FIRM